ncbi:hypothetical protein AK812_SmicGene11134 [Symbiodinium microadriaticum]|uniref:Uncharacterized protein n=1 Tax=Symbiodinium microadriaticum TaxID=2951 RepID=A0A1Q9EE19_SYMMI|nr:hypothetical protein AK812_SmicGene11134 [Symbiodinium microadriaticum]
MPLRCECPRCRKLIVASIAFDPSELPLGGLDSQCPHCHKRIRIIRNSEKRLESAIGCVTVAGSVALCTASLANLAVPAGLAPAVCAVAAAQDMLLGAVRKDRWKCRAGALGLLSAGCTVSLAAADKVRVVGQSGLGRFGGQTAFAYTRRGLENAKSAVSARNAAKNAAGHWLRLKAGVKSIYEVGLTFWPAPPPTETKPVREIELQVFRSCEPQPLEETRQDMLAAETIEDDGWQVLPADAANVLRQEELSLCGDYDAGDEWLVVSEKVSSQLLGSAQARGIEANCTALRA